MQPNPDANRDLSHAIEHEAADMQQKMGKIPTLLKDAAGGTSCCIFRVPQPLRVVNHKAYEPQIVSIGPYHRGKGHLRMVEEHKWRMLRSLLGRVQERNGLGINEYIKAVMLLENRARKSYSEEIDLDTHDFVQMLVLDGFFVIELLRKFGRVVDPDTNDPIFTVPWLLFFLMKDLLKLENQLPFFLLQCLFDLSKAPEEDKPLARLALKLFGRAIKMPQQVENPGTLVGKHLLDLFRSSFLPLDQEAPQEDNRVVQLIPCATKLKVAGIRFQPRKVETFLGVKFRNGYLEIPHITIDDFICSAILNCIALEQCHRHCSKHFTTYAAFMDCLINTATDVEILSDGEIIQNYLGTDEDVAHFFNTLGQDIAFDVQTCYLSGVFAAVQKYYKKKWHVQLASFKNTYFKYKWSFISLLAASALLVLAFLQTFYTIFPYYHKK